MALTTTPSELTATALTLTTAAQPNITSVGTLTTLTVDDITINGSTVSDAADFTIDVGGDIILDAAGSDVRFHNAGTLHGRITNDSNGIWLISDISDKDIHIHGNDGGSMVTALTFDMSDAGSAFFNNDVYIDKYLRLRTTDDQTNSWLFYTHTNDNLEINYNGSGNAEVVIDTSGNVGIGDTAPFAKLEVNDSSWSSGSPYGTVAYIEGGATHDLNWGHLVVSQSGTTTDTGGRISLGANGQNPIAGLRAKYKGATYGDLAFLTRPSGGTNTERMVITSAGNVGIGTTSPTNVFDTAFTASAHTSGISATNLQTGGWGSTLALNSRRSDGGQSILTAARIRTEGAAAWNADNTTNSNLIFEARDANTLSEKMRVTANGDLCIGVTSNAGSASNTKRIRAGVFATYQGATAATHNTPTTMFSLPSGLGTYILSAGFDGIGRTDLYSSLAIVHGDGTSYKMTTLTTSTSMSWDISGSNVRVQQSSGSTLNVSWSMIRIQ